MSAVARAGDEAFCRELLPRVSRTFALSIEALPPSLAAPVRVSYLLCRVVDTIEDEAGEEPERQQELFDAFDELLRDDRCPPEPFEQLCSAAFGSGRAASLADGQLCCGAGAVLRCYRELPLPQRSAIRPRVLEMSAGMRSYAVRAAAAGGRLRLVDLADLERYCYFVAGTVGRLLTALFELEVGELSATRRAALHERAVPFGLALQLVNIVKDVAADLERGRCYLPESLAAAHGLPLAQICQPAHRAAGMAVLAKICARARCHLEAARAYTLLWPLPAGRAVRLFCAVPLGLALATLHEVEHGPDALQPGRTPKVDRATVLAVLTEANEAAGSDEALQRLLDCCREGHGEDLEPGAGARG